MADKKQTWLLDQLTKTEFFHQKLHEWELLEVAQSIEALKGEKLDWDDLAKLNISKTAWDKVIHRGIRPVIVFAHPDVLKTVAKSVGYYRMLSLVSQKSMGQIGLNTKSYEDGRIPSTELASQLSSHFNRLISLLIEADDHIEPKEFDLWRGMAAGSQAQGSWQNTKGSKAEIVIRGLIKRRLRQKGLVTQDIDDLSEFNLVDGRRVISSDEPDIAFYDQDGQILSAVEIKGGIDKAGVLERVGAAIKSLSRAKHENPESTTLLLLQGVSMTEQAVRDIEANQQSVNYWLAIEEVIEDDDTREKLFDLLDI